MNEYMKRVKWTDRIRNEAGLERVDEERMMLKLIRKRKRNWFKVCHGSLYDVMWIADEPRQFNLPTLPQRRINYVPEKLPSKYGVHSEKYLPLRTATPVVAGIEFGGCLNKLGLQNISSDSLQVKKLRQELRERAFQSWCSLNQKGKGVILYKEFTPAKKWIRQPDRLTSSEWRLALKMTANVCPLRAIPGRSRDGNHCCRCFSEIEILGHVLDACPFSETLRKSRHRRIRFMIAEALRKKGLTVHEEVHGISQEGSCRRIDMLAIPPGSTSGYIIDPTIRFEAQEQQPAEVHAEKCRIYEPSVPFYLEEYHLTTIEVVGLMVGARGTIPRLFVTFCKKFQLNNDFIRDVSLIAIRGLLAILKYHLYFVS
ncbi:hypothetical protein ANN_11844 [Periplaneta americana]|uniref:Reverse transcriptase n=1 Tax=Periplaneta americana TaxID=6978 RepID=A0ABQ8T7Y7_PERAM|nr:hypothetical protein ANN_11844 [Periplaneta americana]